MEGDKMKEQPKYKQFEALGINVNLLWEILGGLDNINTIMHYISLELEDYSDVETVKKRPADFLFDEIRRVMQLTYIFDNEFKNTLENTETLLKQFDEK